MADIRNKDASDDESSHNGSIFEASDDDVSQEKPALTLYDKDSDEEDLEQLVFGNRTSFRDNLLDADGVFGQKGNADGELAQAKNEDTGDLEGVEDADLFMIDTGTVGGLPRPSKQGGAMATKSSAGDAAVWEDSDDERLTISLATNNRLRKLRLTEAEDVVSGTEYSRRLRQQYLRLNPAPAWATPPPPDGGRPTKRRRRSSATASDLSSAGDSESDSDGEVSAQPLDKFLRDINSLSGAAAGAVTKRRLRPEIIDIQRLREIPDKHLAAVECLSFHPKYPVLLSASTASVLLLHHIAPDAQPTANPQLTSVQVKGVDVRRAEFLYPEGDRIFAGGRRKYFHSWDLRTGLVQKTTQISGHASAEHKTMERFRLSPCGRYMAVVASSRKGGGVVSVLSAASTQWIASARLTSRHGIADFAWWSDGTGMTILGRDGQVGEYSVERRGFVGLWRDDGCVGAIVVALGGHQGPALIGGDRWVAVGSSSGITNIYDRQGLLAVDRDGTSENNSGRKGFIIKETPTPTRVFEQLITPVTALAFSPDGQLLAFASREKKDALRLAHLPSCTVYRNWPTTHTPLGRITTVAFGRDSNMLAVGNDMGKIRLWGIMN